MKIRYYISVFLIYVTNLFGLSAQNFNMSMGLPYIRNYTPEEYAAHEQNFDIVQAQNGVMYFANFAGVLQFDGTSWNKIPTRSGMRVLSLALNQNGTVFVGGLYDFGFLKQNAQGVASFVSLADSIEDKVSIGEVFKVVCAADKNYFVSENKLFISKNKQIATVDFENGALSAFYVKKQLYVFFDVTTKTSSKQYGLCKFENGKFIRVESLQEEKILDIKTMFRIKGTGDIALASSKQGIFILRDNKIIRLNIAANDYVKQHSLSCIVPVNDETYGIGTLNGGFVLTDTKGDILQIVDKNSGLQDETINAAFIDKMNSVWLATDNGISKAELNWPITYYDNKNTGLEGKVLDVEKVDSLLYFATDKGLFYLQKNNFERIKGIKSACWSLLKYNNRLLVATTNGIFIVKNKIAVLSKIKEFTFCLSRSAINRDEVYAGYGGKASVLQITGGNIETIERIDGLDGDVQSIMEQDDGNILLEIPPGKIYLYSPRTGSLKELKAENEFISLHLNKKRNKIFFSSEKGIFRYDRIKGKISPYNIFANDTASHKLWIQDLYTLSDSSYLVTDGEQKNMSLYYQSKNKTSHMQTEYLPVADFSVHALYNDVENHTFWAGGKDGLLKSDYTKKIEYKAVYPTIIRKIISLANDSLISINTVENQVKKLAYVENSLRFDFSVPVFPVKGKVLYRYYLEGFDKDTSAWTTLTYKDYTNLPDRKYTFIVEAKNEFGKIAKQASFRFQILTPLYRTWWAIALYIVLLVALVYLILKWRMKAAKKEREVLEELIKKRTLEIENSRQEVEKQRDIAYKQKQEILDSIRYAQKIQEAVLPSNEYTEDLLHEHFIMYEPRDIVSGDFYWMKKLNNFITVVAADCTGHGVPGAFMSMLGSSFLNEIVTRRSLDNAGQILNRLRSKVKKSLHQEGKSGEQKDGMDIALIIIDIETLELQYAGAYNPLYIIRKNKSQDNNEDENTPDYELIQLKADRQPIGIHILEKEFTNHSFQLQKDDCLYSFSDGYVDQFGGETGEKFKAKRFKELLLSVQGKSMDEQKRILEQNFIKWKRDIAQIDDVLVMGIKI